MKRRIENGVTILSTGDSKGGLKNKNGHTGIHFYKPNEKYRAEITHKKNKYHLGFFDDLESAIDKRKEAEMHVKNGNFIDWWNLDKMNRNK